MAGRDTFTDLALNESLAGKVMDTGELVWGANTYLFGDGAGGVKLGTIPNGKFIAANVTLPANAKSSSIRFKIGTGKDFQQDVVRITMHGDGSNSSADGLGGVSASLGSYEVIKITDLSNSSNAAEIAFPLGSATDEYELAVEWPDPIGQPAQYRAAVYAVSGGVRSASPVKATDVITLASARPSTARMSQIWGINAPNPTFTGYGWTDSGAGGGSGLNAAGGWTEGGDLITIAGAVAGASAGTFSTPVLRNNTGTILANESGVVVNVYNTSTGALVVRKTGLSSNASGVVTVSDAAIVAGTSYAYEVVLAANGRRLPTVTAA